MKELFHIPFKCYTFIFTFNDKIKLYVVKVFIDSVEFPSLFPQDSIEDCYSALERQYDYKQNSVRFICGETEMYM